MREQKISDIIISSPPGRDSLTVAVCLVACFPVTEQCIWISIGQKQMLTVRLCKSIRFSILQQLRSSWRCARSQVVKVKSMCFRCMPEWSWAVRSLAQPTQSDSPTPGTESRTSACWACCPWQNAHLSLRCPNSIMSNFSGSRTVNAQCIWSFCAEVSGFFVFLQCFSQV